MTIESATFVRDILFFIKSNLSSSITDPIQSSRKSNSRFVMTSYPERETQYPLITIKAPNYSATRAGMQTDAMDMQITIEIRIWARNVKERDELFTTAFNLLRTIQFSTDGSVDSNLHDLNIPSVVEVDEDVIKSKVMEATYNFYNFS